MSNYVKLFNNHRLDEREWTYFSLNWSWSYGLVITFIEVHVCVLDSLEGSPAHIHSGYVHNSVTPQMERRRYSCKSPFLLGQPDANTRYDMITYLLSLLCVTVSQLHLFGRSGIWVPTVLWTKLNGYVFKQFPSIEHRTFSQVNVGSWNDYAQLLTFHWSSFQWLFCMSQSQLRTCMFTPVFYRVALWHPWWHLL